MEHKDTGQLRLAVIGLGHVGLPTALGLADLGWPVVGADDDQAKALAIAEGNPMFFEPGLDEFLRKQLDSGRFQVAPDVPTAMRGAEVLFVCVGTPQNGDGSPDLSQVEGVARTIAANLNGYKLIVEKSTVPVRTAQQLKASISRHASRSGVEDSPGAAEQDFDVGVNPEFLREGTALHDFLNPDRIVLGVESERARELLLTIYRPLVERLGLDESSSIVVTDANTAEIIKHASNALLATKVSFINLVADLCDATGGDVETVARGVGLDPRIGGQFLKAGIGYGGSCFPKDLEAFAWIASEHGVDSSLLREVARINDNRVDKFLGKVKDAVWVIKGKTLAIWGLSFKPGTDDIREASSLGVVRRLLEEGGQLRVHDPRSMNEFRRHFPEDDSRLEYCGSPLEAVEGTDALLLLTEWPEYLQVDLSDVRRLMLTPTIVDGRNLFDPADVRGHGFEYFGIGKR